jgi:hypothetical protein
MPGPRHQFQPIVLGDVWSQDIIITKQGHDFTSPTTDVTCRMYLVGSTTTYKDFTLTPTFASGVTQEFTTTLALTKAESAALTAGSYTGDIVIEQSGSYGPYTVLFFSVGAEARQTPT